LPTLKNSHPIGWLFFCVSEVVAECHITVYVAEIVIKGSDIAYNNE